MTVSRLHIFLLVATMLSPAALADEEKKHSEHDREHPAPRIASPSPAQAADMVRMPAQTSDRPAQVRPAPARPAYERPASSQSSAGAALLGDLLEILLTPSPKRDDDSTYDRSRDIPDEDFPTYQPESSPTSHVNVYDNGPSEPPMPLGPSTALYSGKGFSQSGYFNKHFLFEYIGLGAGETVTHYPPETRPRTALQLFYGLRSRYVGAEVGYDKVYESPAVIAGQPALVGTEIFSLALTGFVPLHKQGNLFLKYGSTHWRANVNASAATGLPPHSGTSQVYGAGLEYWHGDYFIRVEHDTYRNIYQSGGYQYNGIRFGMHID